MIGVGCGLHLLTLLCTNRWATLVYIFMTYKQSPNGGKLLVTERSLTFVFTLHLTKARICTLLRQHQQMRRRYFHVQTPVWLASVLR